MNTTCKSQGLRIADLDFLRGCAVTLILGLHAAVFTPGLAQATLFHSFMSHLGIGMQLFFVLSGYMISVSWEKLKSQGFGKTEFYRKRAVKILPLYFIFMHLNIGLYILQASFGKLPNMPNGVSTENLTLLNYSIHLVLLQGLVPAWQHSLLDGSWSIVAEVYFYVAAPWLLDRYLTRPAQILKWICAAIPIGVLFSYLAQNQVGYWGYYGFPTHFPCFLMGILVQRVRKLHPEIRFHEATLPFVSLASMIALGIFRGSTHPVGLHIVYACLFAAILFAILAGSSPLRNLPASRLIMRLGEMSYSLFFAHLFLLRFSNFWINEYFTRAQWPLAFAVNLTISVLGSWVVCSLAFHRIDSAFVRRFAQKVKVG